VIALRTRLLPIVVVAFALCSARVAGAQTLTLSLFDRYVEALRLQAGIPGMSGAVIQGGAVVWEKGLGRADLDQRIAATPDTPYAIGGLTEALSSSLLLRKCVDQSYLSTLDPVRRWAPNFAEAGTLIGHLLAHAAPGGGFKYDPARFAELTPVVEHCTNTAYRDLLQSDLLDLLGMKRSVAGAELGTLSPQDATLFPTDAVARFTDIVRQAAVPYRVVNGRAQRSDVLPQAMSMQTGIITTVHDLERFDLALRDGVLLHPDTRDRAWSTVTAGGLPLPTGLGWFVQDYNGEPLVWQFGQVKDAWSSLVVKLPSRDVTLILLANSDGLSAPLSLESGDVTVSPFVKTFLKLIAP
jgi:CubicO group peptidase (beta-lactamase class C family)